MRLKSDPLPNLEEAEKETEKRIRIIVHVRGEFEKFCEIMIFAGSVAFGKNYSVRKTLMMKKTLLVSLKGTAALTKNLIKNRGAI